MPEEKVEEKEFKYYLKKFILIAKEHIIDGQRTLRLAHTVDILVSISIEVMWLV